MERNDRSLYNHIREKLYDNILSQHIYDNSFILKSDVTTDRNSKHQHHSLLRAIWNVDRFNPNVSEKLKNLRNLLTKYDANILCDILHNETGEVIAKASPLIVACFEGDSDVIKVFIRSGVDVNQTESEHHLTALHVICDAEFNGQTLTVMFHFIYLTRNCFNFL